MLTIKDCKKLMHADSPLDDHEIESLRDSLYGLAHVFVEGFTRSSSLSDSDSKLLQQERASFQEIVSKLSEDERHLVEERAAIMQVDGGCERRTAEWYALRDFWNIQLSGGKNGQ